ncbi:MAG: hypothetical protein ACKO6E_07035 [Planctomycetota bacterium]
MRQRIWQLAVSVTAVAVLVGPQWCCCTLKSLGMGPTAAEAAGAGCCCCESPAAASSCPWERHQDGDDPCPCRSKSRPVTASSTLVTSLGDLSLAPGADWRAAPPVACWLDPRPSTSAASVDRSAVADRTPVLAGRALLRALSTLRC